MKGIIAKLVFFSILVVLFVALVQPVYALGRRPVGPGGGNGPVQGVPEPMTTLSLLAIGVAGASTYLFIRKNKDKDKK